MSRFEEWRPAPGFPDYLVSDQGRIMRSAWSGNNFARPGKIVNPAIERNGYARASLHGPEGVRRVCVHRLVCEAFHGEPPSPAHEVAHNDGVRANNLASNLRWATRSENHADKHSHGTAQTGERNGNSRWADEIIRKIRTDPRPLSEVAAEVGMNYNYAWAVKQGRVRRSAA